MSQVNVNTPGTPEPAPASDGSGYGFIVGILVAVLVIALLVWLLVFNNGGGTHGQHHDPRARADSRCRSGPSDPARSASQHLNAPATAGAFVVSRVDVPRGIGPP